MDDANSIVIPFIYAKIAVKHIEDLDKTSKQRIKTAIEKFHLEI